MWLPYSLIFLLFILLLWSLILGAKKRSALVDDLSRLQEQLKQHQQQMILLESGIQEIRSSSIGVGQKVKQIESGLQQKIQQLQDAQQEMQQQEPLNPLYQQAARLVTAGASVDDVMQECELSRTEAELLFALKKQ